MVLLSLSAMALCVQFPPNLVLTRKLPDIAPCALRSSEWFVAAGVLDEVSPERFVQGNASCPFCSGYGDKPRASSDKYVLCNHRRGVRTHPCRLGTKPCIPQSVKFDGRLSLTEHATAAESEGRSLAHGMEGSAYRKNKQRRGVFLMCVCVVLNINPRTHGR
jgi:hypothetical protein